MTASYLLIKTILKTSMCIVNQHCIIWFADVAEG